MFNRVSTFLVYWIACFCLLVSCVNSISNEISDKQIHAGNGFLDPQNIVVPDSLSFQDYFDWVKTPQNGFITEHIFDKNLIRISYRPALFDAVKSLPPAQWSKSKIDSLLMLKNNELIIVVEDIPILKSSSQLTAHTSESLGYEKLDPLLVAGEDTLHKMFIHLEYGLNMERRYYIVYGRPNGMAGASFKHAKFIWNAEGTQVVSYFMKKIIESSPKIRYK